MHFCIQLARYNNQAFETIVRKILLQKLQSIGINNIELMWLASYLNTRKQQTKFKTNISDVREVHIGVTQGTAFSVIFFNTYIDSIVKVPEHEKFIIKIINDLEANSKCLNSNKLILNAKTRTQCVCILYIADFP